MKTLGLSQFQKLLFLVVILLVLIMAARTPIDSDLFWHLRAGEWTIQNRTPILYDFFSYSSYGVSWINHSWLAEVIFAGLYQMGGFLGICIFTAILAAISMIFVFITMDGNYFSKAFLIVLASSISAFIWSPRPQLFSMVLLGWMAFILHEYKWKNKKWLWQLPIIFLLWANLHGGYPLGLVLILAYLAGEILNHLMGSEESEILTWREILDLAGWGCLSILVLWINPNGYLIYWVPFQTLGGHVLQRFIQEWASPDFHEISQQVLLIAIFFMFFLAGYSRKKMDGTDVTLFIGFSYMAFVARRNFGPFAITVIPVISRYIEQVFLDWFKALKRKTDINNFITAHIKKDIFQDNGTLSAYTRRLINGILIGLLLFTFIGKAIWVSGKDIMDETFLSGYPVKAVQWIENNNPEGNLLNEYNSGGYLVWALRAYPVFVDGRTDMYGDSILQDWLTMVQADKGWEKLIEKYKIRIVMLNPDRPLVEHLLDANWKKVYEDQQAAILLLER